MKSYSLDLRDQRMVSRQEGKSLKWIATTFQVSVSSVQRLAAQVARMADATLDARQSNIHGPSAKAYRSNQKKDNWSS